MIFISLIIVLVAIFVLAYAGDKATKEREEIKQELKQIKNGLDILFYDWWDQFSASNEQGDLSQKEKDLIEYLGMKLYKFDKEKDE